MQPSPSTQDHLYDLLEGFDTAMLVTTQADGSFRGRPMAVAALKKDADTYFATSLESPKIAEIEAYPDVIVTFQSSSQFAVVKGTASVVRDRAMIDTLWSEAWRLWFPAGKDDPSLCLLKVDAREAEYWDNSGAQGLKFLFEGVKALVQRKRPSNDLKQNAKVTL
jgi:general stress protein 26